MDPRIPLTMSQGLISAMAMVRIPSLHVCGICKFFVDTGSPESFIGQQDADRLNVPRKRLSFTDSALMGGTKISLAQIRNVTLRFMTREQSITIQTPRFRVAKGMWTKKGVVHNNPSILGTDFLTAHNFQLVYWPAEGFAVLRQAVRSR